MRRRRGTIIVLVVAALLTLATAGLLWASDLGEPMPDASAALTPDEAVAIETDPWLSFIPADEASVGFIFYPGARVPPQAYAPAMRAIAEAGYLAVIVPAPFGLPVLAPDAADAVIAAHPEVDEWVIGGHSLGGAMAAQYADGHADAIDGLVLWAAYPPDGTDLSDDDLVAASILASEDGLATAEEVTGAAPRLPTGTTFVTIEGGNHAGFGWYGDQDGDGAATITREAQQEQVVGATVDVLEAVAAD